MKEEKIKRFIECYVPVRACNMKCEYCYVTQNGWFDSKISSLSECENKIGKALNRKRLGGTCMVNLCGTGETLLPKEMPNIIKSILEAGHYVMVVTNGTLFKRFDEIIQFPKEYLERLFFKFSFHYLELKRLKLLDKYFDNIKKIDKAGCSFTVEITPDDSYIPYIQEIKDICMEKLGVLCHVTVTRNECIKGYPLLTKLPREEFVRIWSTFDSELFNFKESVFGEKRKEFCYAGLWSFNLELESGNISQCYKGKLLGNIYENLDSKINYLPIGNNCLEGHCFNAHAFMTFGIIPEIDTPTYAEMRNRIDDNGHEWLKPRMKKFMNTKLIEKNKCCNLKDKVIVNVKSFNYKGIIKNMLNRK